MNKIKKLRELTGMTRATFAAHLNIPYRTIQDWELGNRQCAEYIAALIEYKLKNEGKIK